MAEVDTDSIIFYISQKDTRRVALQFPENLLEDGVKIYSILTKYFLNISFYVLADQTYSCCCVDEITAMHIIPDLIIHFGDACLNSKIHKYPVLYVFPCSSLNFNKFITFLTSEITPSPITILYESCFHHLKDQLNDLREKISDLVVANMVAPNNSEFLNDKYPDFSNNIIHGRNFSIADQTNRSIIAITSSDTNEFISSIRLHFCYHKLFFYNATSDTMTFNEFKESKSIGKRINAIEKVRKSEILGILVNSPSLYNYQAIVDKLKKIINDSGRKSYVVSIGRITPSKLANFANIQAWVLVSCYYNTLINDKEFLRPIITPMECYMACSLFSSYQYSNNLNDFLNLKLDSNNYNLEYIHENEKSSVWKGLEPQTSNMNEPILIEGQGGIAESYHDEPNIM